MYIEEKRNLLKTLYVLLKLEIVIFNMATLPYREALICLQP